MVCSLGSGRMAAMARLLAAEEVGHHKLVAQYIHRELREADEANLLDEEDMHVFDLKPMTDPLHLVCCNACKKPVKVSQYAAHAELCKSLNSGEEIISELDGGAGHKKPPRKERKKFSTAYANQATSVGVQVKCESVDADNIAGSESHLDEQIQMTTSFSTEAKRSSSCVEGALIDGSGVGPGNTDYSAGAMPPPTKRSKLIAAEGRPISDHTETASGVTKSLCIGTKESFTCRDFPGGLSAGSGKAHDNVFGYQKPVREGCLLTKVPLATKMFYSQRSHRLRSALNDLYYKPLSTEHGGDSVNLEVFHGNSMPSQSSSPNNFCHEQTDDHQEQAHKYSLPSVQKPDQVPAQSSDVNLSKSGGSPPAMNFSNQVPVNSVVRPHTAPVGMVKSNYLSKPYSFAGNSGTPLRTLQQPKGGVPVI
ncbi:uncharacterized protein LOC132275239 isoform X2 [Cornus florida]|uniref:uncharacterized protein LOC132275239 isoform X2 n=1 Tax=Cornus florida TaxID=4283 RepID=UPI00289D1C0F|nr:uncharacterized protein LOC132275239 isoform X2 [Cornus florida]